MRVVSSWNIVNINARLTGNGGVFVQYQEDGKSKDAVFMCWEDFISWFQHGLEKNTKRLA